MDLETFVANKDLLERLSHEYELLKASGAEVDYAAWVRQRLREAAAELAAGPLPAENSDVPQEGASEQDAVVTAPAHGGQAPHEAPDSLQLPNAHFATDPAAPAPPQLYFSGRQPQPAPAAPVPLYPTPGGTRGPARPEGAWFIRGEGTSSSSPALAAAIWGPAAATAGTTARTAHGKDTGARKQKRVTLVTPPRSASAPPQSPAKRVAAALHHAASTSSTGIATRGPTVSPQRPVSKLYTPVEPGLFSTRPEAYVHPEARPKRTPLAARRPDWVNAASLQAALKGASSAVPHLQAAAERERRLALSSAIARQTLAAGLDPDEARARALYGVSPAAATSAALQAAQYEHVLHVAHQLAQQNELLTRAVQENSAQLAQQQALLQSTLVGHREGEDGGSGGVAGHPAPGSPAALAALLPGHALTADRQQHTTTSVTRRSTSPQPPSAPSTAKERDRSARKDALKALLKQVLGPRGGTNGEGRGSSMANAEQLVAGILALVKARGKGGLGRAAEDIGGEEGNGEPGGRLVGRGSRAASRVPSRQPSRGAQSDRQQQEEDDQENRPQGAGAAGAGGSTRTSRATSRQASGVSRKSLATSSQPAASLPASRSHSRLGSGSGSGSGPGSDGGPPERQHSAASAGDPSGAGEDAVAYTHGGEADAGGPVGGEVAAAEGGVQGMRVGGVGGGGTAAFLTVTGTGVGGSGGGMVETLEDQVAAIVSRDAQAFAEMERLSKVDLLERRLLTMVDRVEGRLAQALAPMALNAGAGTGLHGQPPSLQLTPEQTVQLQAARLVASGAWAAAAGGAGAGAADQGAGAGLVASPRSAGLSVLELQRMLIQINRMESKEQEVRRKWFRDPCAPSGRLGPGTQPIIVADGMMGTIPPGASAHGPHTTPHRPAGQQHAGAPARAHPRPVPGSVRQRDPATLWHFPPVQPTEDSLAEATAATTATHHPSWTGAAAKAARPGWAALDQGKGRGVGGVGGGVGSVQACDCTASEVLAERHGDPISDGVLESVLRGRRRFLRAQQLADGDLVAASDPRVNPVQIMEDLTDFLLDEMLREQAKDLLSLCDELGEHLYKNEVSVESGEAGGKGPGRR